VTRDIVTLVHDLYDRCRAGELSDAEAGWVLRVVLPEYGLTLEDLARWARGGGGGPQSGSAAQGAAR
jgi:hypothetical protein